MTNHTDSNKEIIIVKVGSSLVTEGGQGVNIDTLNSWARQFAHIKATGCQLVLVSSGAIAEGLKRLGIQTRPKELNYLQAAAAVGQMGLAQAYEKAFAHEGLNTAQILLTHDDVSDRTRYLNARSTLQTLLQMGVIPIINENDTVANAEIKLGDNDTLGALVANLIDADTLIILTDTEGLFDSDPSKNPDARLIKTAQAGDPHLESIAGGAGSAVGTGGMLTKVLAAKRAARSGTQTIIASGKETDVLIRLCQKEAIGTLLKPPHNRLTARKQWLLDQIQISGTLYLDKGAVAALVEKHSSLLPIGCVRVSGKFHRGEVVSIVDEQTDKEIARGLVNYGSEEAALLCRTPSYLIEEKLSYLAEEELVHKNNLVLL